MDTDGHRWRRSERRGGKRRNSPGWKINLGPAVLELSVSICVHRWFLNFCFGVRANGSRKTRNHSREARNHSRDTRNNSRNGRKDSRDGRNDSRDTMNDSRDARNDSRDTRNNSRDTRNAFRALRESFRVSRECPWLLRESSITVGERVWPGSPSERKRALTVWVQRGGRGQTRRSANRRVRSILRPWAPRRGRDF